MAKKGIGKFLAFAAIAGAVAAGISYFTKYKSFHDELEEDFHDFEGGEDSDEEPKDNMKVRSYVPIAKEPVSPEMMERASMVTDKIQQAADAAVGTMNTTVSAVSEQAETVKEAVKDAAEEAVDTVKKEAAEATTITDDTSIG